MKERIKLEKAKKSGKEPVTSVKGKHKQQQRKPAERREKGTKTRGCQQRKRTEGQRKGREKEKRWKINKDRLYCWKHENPRLRQDGPPLFLLILAIIKKLRSLLLVKSIPVLLLYSHH